MKILFSAVVVLSLVSMFGCTHVNPGRENQNSHLGSGSTIWGVPNPHAVTAGFNGSPSEEVGAPSNSTQK